MKELRDRYEERRQAFSLESDRLRSKYNTYAIVRLAVFIIGFIVAVLLWPKGWLFLGFVVVFLLGFTRFVKWHLRVQKDKLHHDQLTLVNEEELRYWEYDYQTQDNGAAFVDADHPYAVDLDIFGDYSFFQYANRAATSIGKVMLATWFGRVASVSEIGERQAAITELSEQLDWRQHMRAHGLSAEDDIKHVQSLQRWLDGENLIHDNTKLKALLWISPLLAIAGVVLYITYLPWTLALLFFLPAGLTLRSTIKRVDEIHSETAKAGDILAHYARLVQHIESGSFSSPLLERLQASFVRDQTTASVVLKKLSYIISQLNVRYNVFVFILNFIGLWDLNWVLRLEKWKTRYREQVPGWFDALAEFEALSSLATLKYNHPSWGFPQIDEQRNTLEAVALGHPLIKRDVLVSNDLSMPTQGHIKLITGSNMAGKSTFLRSVGINIVMAMCGSVVCAKELSLPPLHVYTSMRTTDALHESTSSFYAELKRLKMIIEAVDARHDVFFILDEILKGTNSHDRHTGSRALIDQMIQNKGAGLIATHDLELGDMEAQSDGAIENLRMEVQVESGKLIFDYKIEKGVSESFNATQLMKDMGIKINVRS